MPLYYPGTSNPVSHSFSDAAFGAEFDDALLDQASWKNSRYEGARLKALKINKFTSTDPQIDTLNTASSDYLGQYVTASNGESVYGGDDSYQNLPVITNRTTALYIANTVIGGTEDSQFATIKKHSYVGINKILLIRPEDESVQIIDKQIEPYEEFHRFITTDFPAGSKAKAKIIDESIATNLQPNYRVRMNKGYLLKSFDFQHGGEYSGSVEHKHHCLVENNSMYLYRQGNIQRHIETGSVIAGAPELTMPNVLKFRYGTIEMHNVASNSGSHRLFAVETDPDGNEVYSCDRIGPSFASSSIILNKFTEQFYSGSEGVIKHNSFGLPVVSNPGATFETPVKIPNVLDATSFATASRFIGIDSLDFLRHHNFSASTEQEKTELHITFFEGTKDFAPGFHDERSIGTFEIDPNRSVERGDHCNSGLLKDHEINLKGHEDGRFIPTTSTFNDDMNSAFAMWTGSGGTGETTGDSYYNSNPNGTLTNEAINNQYGCVYPGQYHIWTAPSANQLPHGIGRHLITDMNVYVQGGALGEIGVEGEQSGSTSTYAETQIAYMEEDNYYSGSFSYDISFLDKDHTLIMDIDKEAELFDGIGEKGLVIIPEHTIPEVSFNVEYYLQKAGIIDSTTNVTQNVSPNTQTEQ